MIKLVPASEADLSDIAFVHKKAYSRAHFTSRFPSDLLKFYYGNFFGKDLHVIKAIVDESTSPRLSGFVVCGLNVAERIKIFKKASRLKIMSVALANPLAAFRKVAEQLFYRLFDSVVPFEESPFLILSITSDRSVSGIGAALLEYAKELARSTGCGSVGLYVRVGNIKAISFYLKHGFVIRGYSSGQYYLEAGIA